MLGKSAGAAQRTINDFRCAANYINYMFAGIKGWICQSQINPAYQQDMHHFDELVNGKLDNEDNMYISMNTFYRNKRTVDCLKRLNALYVDIDCYKLGLDKQNVLARLEDDYFEKIVPYPTFVIDSGRGVYLIWKLQNEDRNALPRWIRVQNYLTGKLKRFGADPACKDAARILRVPFSVNTNSDTRVEILRFNDVTYKIRDIELEYKLIPQNIHERKDGKKTYPYNTATEAMRQYATDLASKSGTACPDFNDYKATQEWIAEMCSHTGTNTSQTSKPKKNEKINRILDGYCKDIVTLFKSRQGKDCKREIALFLYRLFTYEMTKDKKMALEKTLELNAAFSCPFPEKYVIKRTKSAERKIDKQDTYHYKRETIIDILEITAEEMKKLVYLIDRDRRKERKRENNQKHYQEYLAGQGKESKEKSMAKRRDAFLALQKDGKSANEIMQGLNISKSTYYRVRAEIIEEKVKEMVKDTVRETVRKTVTVKDTVRETIEMAKGKIRGNENEGDKGENICENTDNSAMSQKLSLSIINALRSKAEPFLGGCGG